MGAAELLAAGPPSSLSAFDLPRREPYFASPVDWRDELLYFLLVDRFSDGAEANRPMLDRGNLWSARPNATDGSPWRWDRWAASGMTRWQGGTLNGVRSKLGYLGDLGVGALWLSPVFKQRGHLDTYHGYGVQNFLEVDPRFGSRDDLVALVTEAHNAGIRVLLDVIFNHSGANWLYPHGVDKAEYTAGQHEFGNWRDRAGTPINGEPAEPEAGVWPTELQNQDAYTRAGTGSLQDNDIDNPFAEHKRTDFEDLRDFALDSRPGPGSASILGDLARCFKYWIALTDCDGFRIDTLKHVSLDQARNFCGTIKEFAANLGKENFFLVGEIAGGDFNERRYLDVVDRNLNAALDIGAMRPTLTDVAKGLRSPGDYFVGFLPGEFSMGSHRMVGNRHVSILDDHDHVTGTKLRFSVDAVPAETQVVTGVAIQLFTLGIPCIYYGTEQAFAGPEASERVYLPDWGGRADAYLREAMFGPGHPRRAGRAGLPGGALDDALPGFGPFGTAGRHCFDPDHPAYRRIAALAAVRASFPVLRHGRQYLRPLSLFGGPFELKPPGELLAWSRVLDDEEALCLVNVNGGADRGGDVLVDPELNAAPGATFRVVTNSAALDGAPPTLPVGSDVLVHRTSDGTRFLEIRGIPPGEVVILINRP